MNTIATTARIQAWHALLAFRAHWIATRLQGGPRSRALEKRRAAAAAAWTALEPSGAPMLLLEGGSLLVCGDMGTLYA